MIHHDKIPGGSMSEQNPEPEETQDVTEDTTDAEESTAQEEDDPELEEIPKQDAWDPQRALSKIKKLNAEVVKAKSKVQEAEEKTKGIPELERKVRAYEVGLEVGLPKELIARLNGDTREEMLADAEQLLSLIGTRQKSPATRKPAEALRGGGQPEQEPEETDLRKLGERMFNR